MPTVNPTNSNEKEGFESSLKRLEEIVAELERGDLSLEQALAKYEEGSNRLKRCHRILEEVQKKIVLISQKEDGNFDEIPFDKNKNTSQPANKPSGGDKQE
jgi:exodeoxyribonuclease VII small subunit